MFDLAISGICRWPGGVLESSPPAAPPAEVLNPRFGHPTPPGSNGFGVALDRVTGLRNQRVLWKELAQRAVACSESSPLAVVVLDFDRFEEVNERYNRSVGDQVLRVCAEAARAEAPSANLAFRYRDDELVLLVPGDEEDGGEVAERVRDRIAAQNTKLPAVTVSVGVAVLRAPVEPIVALAKAGPALQAAKRAGGNRVVLTTELGRNDQNGNGATATSRRMGMATGTATGITTESAPPAGRHSRWQSHRSRRATGRRPPTRKTSSRCANRSARASA